MDFLTLLSYILAIVETGALIATLVYVTKAMHEKKNVRTKQGKKGGKSSDISQALIKGYYRNAGIFLFVYLLLNALRLYSGIFD